jgi:beta-glucanase (GH16 family)
MLEPLPSRLYLSTIKLTADFTGDGLVDSHDFAVLCQHFGQSGKGIAGDANGDGHVNALDFNAIATQFGCTIHGRLVFSDEFVGTKLNPVWTPSQYWWPDDHTVVGTDELEAYDSTGVKVTHGMLELTARKESKYGEPYVSGLVQTGGKQDHPSWPQMSFLYGYIEVRAKLPAGQGFWPAIWMMPASHHDGNGEIDVMESLGNDTHTVYMTVHHGPNSQGHHYTGPDFSAGFHTFAVDWEPDHVTWYVDGVARATCSDPSLILHEAAYPILNLAVGGNWPGDPTKSTPFPSTMSIDYVRIYQ